MKKLIAFACSVVLAASMAMTAMAAPSVSAGVVSGVTSATDKDGNYADVIVEPIEEKYADVVEEVKDVETVKEILGSQFEEGMKVVDVKEVKTVGDVEFPVTITFKIKGVTASSKVILLHYTGSEWEVVPCTPGNGTVTATFTSLSPVAFIVDQDTVADGTTSPSTGESMMYMWAVAAVVVGAAGVVATSKKRA